MDINRVQKTHNTPARSPTDSPLPTTHTNNPFEVALAFVEVENTHLSALVTDNTEHSYAYCAGQLITAPHFRQRLGADVCQCNRADG